MKILVPNLSDCELMFRNSLNMGWRDTLYLSLLVHPQTQSQRQDVIIIPTVSFFSKIFFSPPTPSPPAPTQFTQLDCHPSGLLVCDLTFHFTEPPNLVFPASRPQVFVIWLKNKCQLQNFIYFSGSHFIAVYGLGVFQACT